MGQGRGRQVDTLRRMMKRFAESTGGAAVFEDAPEDLRRAFAAIRTELASQYLLGYVSTNEARDGAWRRIRVDVTAKGRVRARDGYFAPAGP